MGDVVRTIIELASSVTPLYLRQHDDGALSWTSKAERAHQFPDEQAAMNFATYRISGDIRAAQFP